MSVQGDPEATNRQAAEHIARTRKRLEEGRAQLARMHESLRDTDAHLGSIRAWIDETERHLRRARRVTEPPDAAA